VVPRNKVLTQQECYSHILGHPSEKLQLKDLADASLSTKEKE
jgi:hypothetical protein